MKYWDYHTHCYLCKHATGAIEDYIKSAIVLEMREVGISDHFPMDLLPEHFHIYSMTLEEFPKYIDEIIKLKKQYKNQIAVKIATEVDFFPSVFDSYKKLLNPFVDNFDYLLGSVHAIPYKSLGALPIDEKNAVPLIKEIGIDRVYLEYYDSVFKMVKTNFYDIVGHFDLPKKFGLLPENPDLIWPIVLRILDHIESNEMAVEINTSGLWKSFEQYPSESIIKELINRKIPITLGSDAHRPQDVGRDFDSTVLKVKKLGLKKLCQFNNREKTLTPLN